jgi:hypothetical protein
MVSATYAYWQRSPVPNRQRRMPPAVARAIEFQLPIENSNADRTLCRIVVLPARATAAEPHLIHVRAVSDTRDGSADAGGWLPFNLLADEEPTWEDAEWR